MKYITNNTISEYIAKLNAKKHGHNELVKKVGIVTSFIDWMAKENKVSKEDAKRFLGQLSKITHTNPTAKPSFDTLSPKGKFPLRYVGYILLVLTIGILGAGIYNRFFLKTKTPLAFSTSPVKAGRTISFQGRLTDSLGNPITAPIDITYNFYTDPTGGSPISGSTRVCTANGDVDGVFSSLIGNDLGPNCSTELPDSIFTENPTVYLGVTVGSEVNELSPRQQIANVGYAINAETLQGMPPGQTTSTVPFINQDGDLLVAVSNPGIRSTIANANFTISSAQATTIQSAGSGDITLSATQGGALRFNTYNGTLGEHMTILANGNVGISNVNPTMALDIVGSATTSGNLSSGGQIKLGELTSAPTSLGAGSLYYNSALAKVYYNNGTTWTEIGAGATGNELFQRTLGSLAPSNITDAINTGAIATSSALVHLPGTTNQDAWFNLGTGNVGIGTMSPTAKLYVSGTVGIEGNLDLGAGTSPARTISRVAQISNDQAAGLTISSTNANGDITLTPGSSGDLLLTQGNFGIGITSPTAKLDVTGNLHVSTYATVSASLALGTSNAAAGAGNLDMSGNLTIAGAIKPGGNAGTSGYVLTSSGGGVNTWVDPTSLGGASVWQRTLGSLAPLNITDALNLGATATSSALVHLPGTNNQDAWFNLGTGNVGIGTISPTAKLEVSSIYDGSLGAELITNGTFTGSATGWTLSDAASYNNNNVVVNYTGSGNYINTSFATVYGKIYSVSYTLSNVSGDTVSACLNNWDGCPDVNQGNGTHTFTFRSNSTGTETITFNNYNNASGSTWTIDDVSIKEEIITPALKVTAYDGSTALSLGGDALENTAMGLTSFASNTVGGQNTALGYGSLYNNTEGYVNTALGYKALYNNTLGSGNIALGSNAGTYTFTYANNANSGNSIYLGNDARALADGDYNEIVIGNNAVGAGSNTIVLGDSNIQKIVLNGNLGIGTTAPSYDLDVQAVASIQDLIAYDISFASSSANIIRPYTGFNGYVNFSGGIGTGGVNSTPSNIRLTSTGNLVNIGSIQAGETLLTRAGTFATKVDYGTGTTPYSVAVGDFNGDGKSDLVTANNGSSTFSVFINNGSGTFASKVDYAVAGSPTAVAVGDFNGDGKTDFAGVTASATRYVYIFFGNGNGTFTASTEAYYSGGNATSVSVGDLNGDGKDDMVVSDYGVSFFGVYINKGNGTFNARDLYYSTSPSRSSAIGDLNGDGKSDFVVTNTSSNSVSVFINNGNGTFATKVDYGTGTTPYSVAIGDLNGDGKPDLAVANNGSTSVSVLLNNGNGTFATKVDYGTGTNPYSVAIGDLNGDGKSDLAVANYTSNTVSAFLNNGDGTFATKVDYGTGSRPYSVAIGDLNGDGKSDLAVTNSNSTTVSVLLNQPSTMFYAQASSGNVGIGNLAPIAKLDVTGNLHVSTYATVSASLALGTSNAAAGAGNLDMSGNLTIAGAIKLGGDAGTSGYVLTSTGGGANTWTSVTSLPGTTLWQRTLGSLAPLNITDALNLGATATSSALVHLPGTNNQDAWFNLGTGNVGIGTMSPGAKLEANTTSGAVFSAIQGGVTMFSVDAGGNTVVNNSKNLYSSNIHSDGGWGNITLTPDGAGDLHFATDSDTDLYVGTDQLFINGNTGNIGIGNIAPTAKLDVTGNLHVSTYATVSASLALGTSNAAPGPGNLDMSGNLTIAGAIKPGGDAGTSGYVLTSTGGGINTWTPATSLPGASLWQRTLGSLAPLNITDALNLGATATSSALVHLPGTTNHDAWFNLGTGNVGIGTTTPTSRLQIYSSDSTSESLGSSSTFSSSGTAKTWNDDDNLYSYTIPFSFPFYGQNITNIQVSTNGVLWMCASCGNSSGYPNPASVPSQKIIAPLWADLVTNGSGQSGEDIYVDESVPNQVTIRWKGEVYGTPTDVVNFSATLHSDGTIVFKYGSGNTNLKFNDSSNGVVAVSDGNGNFLVSSISGATSQTNTNDITFTTLSVPNVFSIDTASKNILTARSSGRIGIGTTTPNNLLQVAGLINFDSANNNTFLGGLSGYSNTTGNGNVAIGDLALYTNATGSANVAIGAQTLYKNNGGEYNVAIGLGALYENTTGSGNFALGYAALSQNKTGSTNFALGPYAGSSTSDANNSVYIGINAQPHASGGDNEIVIGNSATGAGSNTVTLGNNNITSTLLKGNVGIGMSPTYTLDVDGEINATGAIRANGDAGTSGYILTSSGGGVNTWTNPASLGGATLWQRTEGSLAPLNITDDINIGSTATASALVHLPGLNNKNAWFNLGTGNVGIGTTTPGGKLDVSGGLLAIDNGDMGTPRGIRFRETTDTTTPSGAALYQANNNNLYIQAGSADYINLRNFAGTNQFTFNTSTSVLGFQTAGGGLKPSAANSTTAIQIKDYSDNAFVDFDTTNQRVGIGTTSPLEKLHVSSSVATGLYIETTDASTYDPFIEVHGAGSARGSEGFKLWYDNSAGSTYFDNQYSSASTTEGSIYFRTKTSGTPVDTLTMSPPGNVGIGTTTPGAKLHVIGDILADQLVDTTGSGAYYVNPAGSSSLGGNVTIASTYGVDSTAAGTLYLGNTNATTIAIGTSATARTLTLGNTTGATAINFNTGTGGTTYTTTNGIFTLNTGIGNISLGTDAVAKIIAIGNATGATGLTLNSGTGDITLTSTDQIKLNSSKASGGTTTEAFSLKTTTDLAATDEVLQIGDSALDMMTVLGNGNVGIGIAAPSEKLSVLGSGYFKNGTSSTAVKIYNSSVGQYTSSGISLSNNETSLTPTFSLFAQKDTAGAATGYSTLKLRQANSTATAWIDYLNISENTNDIEINGGNLTGYTRGDVLIPNGNVGINTTNPGMKLDVTGSIRASADQVFGVDSDTHQIIASGLTDQNKRVYMGYDTTGDYGYIQSHLRGTSSKPLVLQPSTGNVGIGTTAPVAPLHVAGTTTGTTQYGAYFDSVLSGTTQNLGIRVIPSQTSISSSGFYGFDVRPQFSATSGGPQGVFYGVLGIPQIASTAVANVTSAYGGYFRIDNGSTAGSVLTNAYGVGIMSPTATGTITNAYGLYIPTISTGSTSNYSIYTGTADSYFGGDVYGGRFLDITGSGAYYVNPAGTSVLGGNIEMRSATPSILGYDSSTTTYYTLHLKGQNNTTTASVSIDGSGSGDGKLDVGTVDPPYTIDGKKYATYLTSMTGVKEETAGVAHLTQKNGQLQAYTYTIDFNTQDEASDLWLFSKTTNLKQNIKDMTVLLSSSSNGKTWYTIDKEKQLLTFFSTTPADISYRLTAPRFDASSWANRRDDNDSNIGFVINSDGTLNSGNTNQVAYKAPTLTKSDNNIFSLVGDFIDEFMSVNKALIANLRAGVIETEDIIINNALTARETITTSLTASVARVETLIVSNRIKAPVVETVDLKASGSSELASISTNNIKPLEKDVVIDLSKNSSPSGSLARLVINGLDNASVTTFDSAGNATLSGTLVADQVIASSSAFGSSEIAELSTNNASVSGTLIAKEIQAENINSSMQQFSNSINDVQQQLASLKTAPLADVQYYQKLDDSVVGNITITDTANIYKASISDSLMVGSLLFEQNSLLALSSDLKISSLSTIHLFDDAVVIAKNGTMSVKGEVSASSLAIKNTVGETVASIDASGSARFNEVVAKKFTLDKIATNSALIADSGIKNTENETIPAIKTNMEVAGTGVIPQDTKEVAIYNDNVTSNSLIYLTPTADTAQSQLSVAKKFSCPTGTANGACTPYFVISSNSTIHSEIPFNWLIIN